MTVQLNGKTCLPLCVLAFLLPAFAGAQNIADVAGGGQAVSRGGDSSGGGQTRGGDSSGGGQTRGGDSGSGGAVSRGGDSSGGIVSRGGDSGGGRTMSRPPATSTPSGRTPIMSDGARPREDRPAVGRAIPRPPDSPGPGGTGAGAISTVYYGGYYPWGYGGLGLGGYYGWYDPFWYDPYSYGYGGAYYGSPWDGGLRLRVKPNDAEVYVDGYFAGVVDEFDNLFQQLRVETGPHRIEIRQAGYEPLSFEVRILPDRTITYRGQLKRLP